MKKTNKLLLIKWAKIGLEHAPKSMPQSEKEDVARLLTWMEAGATGNWDEVRANPEMAEGFAVNPMQKAKIRKATRKKEPVHAGVNIPES